MTNMSEIMSKKISVLDISIDNFTAKEAMQEALAYMESDLVSVIELVTIESLMELGTEAELKEEIENFDLILAGNKTILEAAEITDHKCLRETQDKTFLKMFLRYLQESISGYIFWWNRKKKDRRCSDILKSITEEPRL